MAGSGKKIEPPDIGVVLESIVAQHIAASLLQVGHELLMKLGERHRPAASQGGESLAVLKLARELKGRHANVLDLLDGHVGMEGGDGVPAALVTDADVDARLANAKAHERLAFLQDVVAGFRGGGLAESLLDDSRIDPGNRGAGGSTGHQCASLFIRRLGVALRELGSGISVSFRPGHALESGAEPVLKAAARGVRAPAWRRSVTCCHTVSEPSARRCDWPRRATRSRPPRGGPRGPERPRHRGRRTRPGRSVPAPGRRAGTPRGECAAAAPRRSRRRRRRPAN